ncbi:hypothetical protein, partial [Xenorhabdus bovienii]|uniref:hypothetical protein n=1 Tax=Xenorhabdus bovienii TaxID=40576 RepID=UPI00237C914A
WDFFDLAINQIAKTGLSSLQVIYYFESLFRRIYSRYLQNGIPSLSASRFGQKKGHVLNS